MGYRVVESQTGKIISNKDHMLMSDAQREQERCPDNTEVIFEPYPVTREQAGYRSKEEQKKMSSFGFNHFFSRIFGRRHESDLR